MKSSCFIEYVELKCQYWLTNLFFYRPLISRGNHRWAFFRKKGFSYYLYFRLLKSLLFSSRLDCIFALFQSIKHRSLRTSVVKVLVEFQAVFDDNIASTVVPGCSVRVRIIFTLRCKLKRGHVKKHVFCAFNHSGTWQALGVIIAFEAIKICSEHSCTENICVR